METGVNFNMSHAVSIPASKCNAENTSDDLSMLPADFEPGETDVICQRGKDSFEHPGNKIFRELIEKHIASYLEAISRHEKSTIVAKIYDRIRHSALKPSTGFDLLTRRWFVVNEKEARDKVGQALRDAIKIIRSNSRKVKPEKTASINSKATCLSNESTHESLYTCKKRSISSIKGEKIEGQTTELHVSERMRQISDLKIEGQAPHTMISRSLENQTEEFRQLSTRKKNRVDDLDGLAGSTMLESSIEPLATTDIDQRTYPSSDSCTLPNAFSTARHHHACGYLQEVISQSKLSPQMPTNSDFLENSEARIPKEDQLSEWHKMNAPSGSTSFLPVIGGASIPLSLSQSEQNAQQFSYRRLPTGSPWDLEPTPLNGGERRPSGNEQRAAALARLLFNEESYL